MTSKSLFFDLMKEDMRRRLWTIALVALAGFFAYPTTAAVLISGKMDRIAADASLDIRLSLANKYAADIYSGWLCDRGLTSLALGLLAMLLAISGFSWLFSPKQTDFYHSIPVKREMLFFAVVADSILIAALPTFIMSALGALLIAVNTGVTGVFAKLFPGFALHMAFFFLCYAACVTAVMLTGNVFVCILGAGTFYFYGPAAVAVAEGMCEKYFKTYAARESVWQAQLMRSSPFLWCFDLDAGVPLLKKGLICVVLGCILVSVCLWLYRRRPSEAAGRAMAFAASRAPIKICIAAGVSVCSAFFMQLFFTSDAWLVFGLLCGAVITGCLMEIIFDFDFGSIFKNRRHIVMAACLSGVIIAAFRFDLTGYDAFMPDLSKLSGAGIYSESMESGLYEMTERIVSETDPSSGENYMYIEEGSGAEELVDAMELSDMELVGKIAEYGISCAKAIPESSDSMSEYTVLLVAYHYPGGRSVYRNYSVPVEFLLSEEMSSLYDAPEFKKALYPIFSQDEEDISSIHCQTAEGFFELEGLDEAAMQEIFKCLRGELMSLDAETRRNEVPYVCLQFRTREMKQLEENARAGRIMHMQIFNNLAFYPVYPSFEKTIALLGKYGLEADRIFDADEVESITICDYRDAPDGEYYEDDSWHHNESITDAARIRELLSGAGVQELIYSNSMRPVYYGMMMEVRLKDDDKVYTLNFQAQGIPDFVMEMYDMTEDDVRRETGSTYWDPDR